MKWYSMQSYLLLNDLTLIQLLLNMNKMWEVALDTAHTSAAYQSELLYIIV